MPSKIILALVLKDGIFEQFITMQENQTLLMGYWNPEENWG